MSTFEQIMEVRRKKGAGYFVLIDPDKWQISDLINFAVAVNTGGADGILIGGSLLLSSSFDEIVLMDSRNFAAWGNPFTNHPSRLLMMRQACSSPI